VFGGAIGAGLGFAFGGVGAGPGAVIGMSIGVCTGTVTGIGLDMLLDYFVAQKPSIFGKIIVFHFFSPKNLEIDDAKVAVLLELLMKRS